jgi:dTDP-4-dehydrorhamnose reductase
MLSIGADTERGRIDADTERGRIGVTGPNGRLGSELVRRGCVPVVADITQFHVLKAALGAAAVDVIVHCAAMTDVDGCEGDPLKAAATNVGGVYNLLKAYGGKIVYISTDYIFDGGDSVFLHTQPAGPYSEDWPPNPISIYGWTKLGGELLLRNSDHLDHLVVRTTMLFDDDGDDFVGKVLAKLLRGEFVYVPDDLFGSPTYVPHLADDILTAVEKNVSGVLNLAGAHVLSRYHFARIMAKMAGVPLELVRRVKREGGAPRPKKAGLATNKAHRLGFPVRDPLEPLARIVAERKESGEYES